MQKRLPVFMLLALLMVPAATPQVAVSNDTNDVLERKDALFFVRIAGDVYGHLRHLTPNNFLAFYIDQENWNAAMLDRDLAPFLELKDARRRKTRNGRSAACIFSPDRGMGLCVYFDGESPFGVATARVSVSGRIEPQRVAYSYQGASKDLLKKNRQKLNFLPTGLIMDDGRILPAFLIKAQ